MTLWEYYIKVLKNYVNFKGRARRQEYWGFILFNFLIAFALAFAGNMIGDEDGFLGGLYSLAVFLPSLAVLFRRLHDTGKSGWFWLLIFIPIVGWIILLVWACTDSQPGENKYGLNPKT